MEEQFGEFFQTQKFVGVSNEKIDEFACSFQRHEEDFKQSTRPLRVPLNFENIAEECNFFAIRSLLSVGSAFEHRSHEAHQDHLSDIVLTGIFGAFISHSNLDTNFMKSVTSSDAGQYFSLPLTEKMDLPSGMASFAVMEKPGGLIQLAELYSNILIRTGIELEKRGYQSMSSLLFEITPGNCHPQGLLQLIRDLSSMLPHLDDRNMVSTQSKNDPSLVDNVVELPFFMCLRRLIFDLCHRFHENNTERGCVSGIHCQGLDELAGAPNARTINALLQLGVLIPLEDQGSQSSDDRVAYELAMRTSAVYAIQKIAAAIRERHAHIEGVNALSLSIYLDKFDKVDDPVKTFIPQMTGISW